MFGQKQPTLWTSDLNKPSSLFTPTSSAGASIGTPCSLWGSGSTASGTQSGTASLFSTPPTSGPGNGSSLFGKPATVTSSLFGSTPNSTSTTSLFGTAPTLGQAQSTLGFNNNNNNNSTSTTAFGSSLTAGSTNNLFGSIGGASNRQLSGGSATFGAGGGTSGSSLFGSLGTSSPVGGATSGLTTTTSGAGTGSIFGPAISTTTTSSGNVGGLFGTTVSKPATGAIGSSFGTSGPTTIASTTGGIFGSGSSAPSVGTGSLFGTAAQQGTGGKRLFGESSFVPRSEVDLRSTTTGTTRSFLVGSTSGSTGGTGGTGTSSLEIGNPRVTLGTSTVFLPTRPVLRDLNRAAPEWASEIKRNVEILGARDSEVLELKGVLRRLAEKVKRRDTMIREGREEESSVKVILDKVDSEIEELRPKLSECLQSCSSLQATFSMVSSTEGTDFVIVPHSGFWDLLMNVQRRFEDLAEAAMSIERSLACLQEDVRDSDNGTKLRNTLRLQLEQAKILKVRLDGYRGLLGRMGSSYTRSLSRGHSAHRDTLMRSTLSMRRS